MNLVKQTPLELIYRLRWCAIVGQIVLYFILTNFFNLTLPIKELSIIIAVTILTNFGLKIPNISSNENILHAVLILDTILLTGLLYLSGGPTNPFSILYLVHVAIAALFLGSTWTWIMVGLTSLSFSFLFMFHFEIPELSISHHTHNALHGFSFHLHGMLLAFILTAVLLGYFLSKMSEAIKNSENIKHENTLLLLNQQKLAALTSITAGAAHELSTPLSTISLVVSELTHRIKDKVQRIELGEDLLLIKEQIFKCKSIIEQMGKQNGEIKGDSFVTVDKDTFISELQEQLLDYCDCIDLKIDRFTGKPVIPLKPLFQSVVSLVKNAVEATTNNDKVLVKVLVEQSNLSISIEDNGIGVSEENLRRVGEPFFTTKETGKGMGLGVFLAKLFVSELNGSLKYESSLGKGTKAILSIPTTMNLSQSI